MRRWRDGKRPVRVHTEIHDGVEFKVTVLPEAKPPRKRDGRTHYTMRQVGKPGGDS